MSLLEDLYAVEDENDDAEENIAEDLERVVDGPDQDLSPRNSDEENDRNSHSEAEEEKPKKVEPPAPAKVRVVRPRAVLNPKRLTGPRGISTIEGFFKDFKFKGKGHERDDLDLVLKKMEHWAHRLYPKFQFQDCIGRIEGLGKKKEVNVHIRKIRMGMVTEDVPIIQNDSDDDQTEPPTAPPVDEFDILLEQQVALARSTPHHQRESDVFFGHVADSCITPIAERVQKQPEIVKSPQLTAEQTARMMQNRLIAEQRRLERMKLNVTKDTTPKETVPENSAPKNSNSEVSALETLDSVPNNFEDDL